jgi:hypothetical protein
MRRSLRNGLAALLVLSTGVAGGCLSVEQDACEAGATLCVDGSVWACLDDGSGWIEEARCPGLQCQAGRCVLPPPPSFDVASGEPTEDVATPPADAGAGDDGAPPDHEAPPADDDADQ